MNNHRKTLLKMTVVVLAVGGPVTSARAQMGAGGSPAAPAQATPPTAAPPPAGSAPGMPPADVMPDVPAGEAGSPAGTDDTADSATNAAAAAAASPTLAAPISPLIPGAPSTAPAAPLIFPSAGALQKRRVKALQTTVGLEPTAPDFGAEADLVSTANEGTANIRPRRWTFVPHFYLRAPLRIGIGPELSPTTGVSSGTQAHSPPHLVGASPNDWNSVGLSPTPFASIYLTAANAIVSGTLVISGGTFIDSGYKVLDEMGGISQGYVTMKFADLFGKSGGLTVNAGAFTNRYGLAGPHQNSSGYYNTYLFGRTRVVGETITADIDLTEHLELVVEHGFGAKMETVPWLFPSISRAPYLPDQGPTPQGSNFVHHLHVALLVDDWFRVAGHYMTSWTPNDLSTTVGRINGDVPNSRIDIVGGEVHIDRLRTGSGFIGYSHLNAERILSLADGIQLLHASNGLGLIQNYLNPAYAYAPGDNPANGIATTPGTVGDSGKIDTVLFQYMLRMAPLLDLPATGRDLTIAAFGMFNHVTSASLAGGKQDKLKFGGEAQFAAFRYLSAGVRFDRVMPNGGEASVAYSALSPRLILHSSWLSREYIIINYTRYFLGSGVTVKGAPYDPVYPNNATREPDKNLLVLSALIAF